MKRALGTDSLNEMPKKVLVIGSGPIIIGQAAEFDYAGTQACRSLREEGVEVVLVNSNPATIMTDEDMADRIYIEPLTVPVLERIIDRVFNVLNLDYKNYIKVNPKLLRDGDPVEIFSNPQKLKNDYRWEPKYNLESFIKKIINYQNLVK